VEIPTQECRLNMLGMGGSARLWESNTAHRPMMAAARARIITKAWRALLVLRLIHCGVTRYMMEPRPINTMEEVRRKGCQANCLPGSELQANPPSKWIFQKRTETREAKPVIMATTRRSGRRKPRLLLTEIWYPGMVLLVWLILLVFPTSLNTWVAGSSCIRILA